jgi:hypothetical protein
VGHAGHAAQVDVASGFYMADGLIGADELDFFHFY